MKIPARLLSAYFWVFSIVLTIFFFSCCAVAQGYTIISRGPRDGRRMHYFASLWGRCIVWMMPGWKVSITGTEFVPKDGTPAVMVANHESMADILAMFFLKAQFRWLSKAEVFKIPFVGPAMRWAGYVAIRRGERSSHGAALAESKEKLKMGLMMFFFPEGTRSTDGQIKPFKMGAFLLARDAQAPVIPIAIHGAAALLPKGSGTPGRSHVRITVLPPQPPPAPDDEHLEAYAEGVRQRIIAAHNQLT